MHKVYAMAAVCGAFAWTGAAVADEVISVAAHTMLRLPNSTSIVAVDRIEVADDATLLVPASLGVVEVRHLILGHNARIAVAPSQQDFRLTAQNAEFSPDSWISAQGAAGNYTKPAMPGRNLLLHFDKLTAQRLLVDAHGGTGTPGFAGLDGGNGTSAGCLWGGARRGFNGNDGGNGMNGADGGHVRVEVPQAFPVDAIQVNVAGGAGGAPGKGGKGGGSPERKGCLLYRTDGAKAGQAGQPGQVGSSGAAGSVAVARH